MNFLFSVLELAFLEQTWTFQLCYRYTKYESTFSRHDYDHPIDGQKLSFPIIIACANNMHDAGNLRKLYPDLTMDVVHFLYGSNESAVIVGQKEVNKNAPNFCSAE